VPLKRPVVAGEAVLLWVAAILGGAMALAIYGSLMVLTGFTSGYDAGYVAGLLIGALISGALLGALFGAAAGAISIAAILLSRPRTRVGRALSGALGPIVVCGANWFGWLSADQSSAWHFLVFSALCTAGLAAGAVILPPFTAPEGNAPATAVDSRP
jgi:hypothetical protein